MKKKFNYLKKTINEAFLKDNKEHENVVLNRYS